MELQFTKHKIENYGVLWHKRLVHISRNRVKKLNSEGILDPIDYVCVECIKGK